MPTLPAVRVNRNAADRIASGHPWIFSSDVLDRGASQPGDAVRVLDGNGRVLGTAHYSSTSQISLRMLSNHLEDIDENFLRRRIEAAYLFRRRVVSGSDAYRLVHAEGDLLPALIIDRYADWFVVQLLDQGMDRLAPELVRVLISLFVPKGIIARNDVATRAKENLAREIRVLAGDAPERIEINMNDLTWQADLLSGQKTGVFLDQRENYIAARRYARGRALDCFTGTGGFALHLASVCEAVDGIDSSARALAIATSNAAANRITNVNFREVNVMDYLPSLVAAKRQLDIVVVDPPAFSKSRSVLESAVRGYKEINLRALRLLKQGGILVTCSCSHHMSEARFLEVVAQAALDSKKQLRVLERRTQPQDHPILLTVPETHYLKCLILEVI
ncbi:MAG: class I SAM-dependent rRNA methyltransferase [Acidobacteriaceae bacterium]|nr:class I SAM-dependent rRNA methyltransferase [Acidobacteriaceae bacterium]MBV9779971.1 class I SAM-dependent rRNA methyltransferase [Acidobacteriaceae bacterium]